MKDDEKSVIDDYGWADLGGHIVAAFKRAGERLETHKNTASFRDGADFACLCHSPSFPSF